MFQSLTRDSNHSNTVPEARAAGLSSFNPSRGIAIIQTRPVGPAYTCSGSFNPSRGIAIIQTSAAPVATAPRPPFQSLTRDSNHSNKPGWKPTTSRPMFQSLTRDSNHSNQPVTFQLRKVGHVSIPHAG